MLRKPKQEIRSVDFHCSVLCDTCISDCKTLIPGKCPGTTDTQAGNITCWSNGSKDAEQKCNEAKKTWWHVFSKDCNATKPGPCPVDWDKNNPSKFVITNSGKIHNKNFELISNNHKLKIDELNKYLFKKNIQSIIVEGGKKTLDMFIKNNCWDEVRIIKNENTISD